MTNPLKMVEKMLTHLHRVVLAHLQRRRRIGKENIFRCALNYMIVLGLEFCVDPLCFGRNMHVGCVALCINFPKCLRSSKSEFGAKSYSCFCAKRSVTGCVRSVPVSLVESSVSVFNASRSDRTHGESGQL